MPLTASHLLAAIALGQLVAAQLRPPPPGGGGGTTGGTACSKTGSDAAVSTWQDGTYRYITYSGCPNYDYSSQTTPNTPVIKNTTIKVPLRPKLCATPLTVGISASSPVLGPLGVTVSGVVIFGNADANKQDAIVNEGATMDTVCGGHAAPDGTFHFHDQSPCLDLASSSTPTEHSPLFGFFYDGIPIFGLYGDGGRVPTDLDSCGGHVDATHPFYHYHLQSSYPYTIECMRGQYVTNSNANLPTSGTSCAAAATQYDYSALDNLALAVSPGLVQMSYAGHAHSYVTGAGNTGSSSNTGTTTTAGGSAASSSSSAAVIGGAVGGSLGGLLLIFAAVKVWKLAAASKGVVTSTAPAAASPSARGGPSFRNVVISPASGAKVAAAQGGRSAV